MYCSNCGTYNENGASFCKHCGKQLITYNEKNNASVQKKSETIFDRVNKFVDKQEEHLDFKLSDYILTYLNLTRFPKRKIYSSAVQKGP